MHSAEKTSGLLVVLFMVVITAFPETVFAGQSGLNIKAQIGNLRFEGKDVYSLVVITSNSSSNAVRVKIVEEGFFIQTDRGWLQLEIQGKDREGKEYLLPSLKQNKRSARLRIPLTIPKLFRTYEGDLSLVYRYTYMIQALEGTESIERADEVYCWIKPGTSDWILREGM